MGLPVGTSKEWGGSMSDRLRVMSYNILFGGASPGLDRTDLIVEQVNRLRPDVLGLCECWGFLDDDGARGKAFCAATGMQGEFAAAPSGNHVGLLYREPWTATAARTVGNPMHHGLVRLRLSDGDGHQVMAVAAHLNSYSSLLRMTETQIVMSRTQPGEHTVVMGDFNTLPLGFEGRLPVMALLDENLQPDTQVCRYYAAAGFTDLLAKMGCTLPTFPTSLEAKGYDYLGGVRLDYIMASESLAPLCTGAWVVDNAEAQRASDHLPVVADFVLN